MTATERDQDDSARSSHERSDEITVDDDVTVFSADSAATTVTASIREVWQFRGFISYMTRRNLRTTYLRSYLGWIWSLLNPIAEVAIYSFVFGVLLDVNRAVPDAPGGFSSFPHFLISGIAVWGFYRMVSGKVLNNFTATVVLRRKLYFPPAAAAISTALSTLVEASILLVVVVAFFGLWGHLTIHAVVLIPAALFAATTGLGVGLALSVANAKYRDISYIYNIGLRLTFYLLPLIWPVQAASERFTGGSEFLVPIVTGNPFAVMIEFGRTGILFQEWPPLSEWLYLGGFSLAVLYGGWTIFARSSADVAEGLQ